MMISDTRAIILLAVMVLITATLRIAPFIIFGSGKKTPGYIVYLGRVLPYAIIGMLVVYSLKNVSILSSPFGIPEAIACAIVVLLHIWKRSTLISVFFGVASYMLLLRLF
ncbi:MAG: AzlD domain-containing protein [Oscillospiraceae bacterium]|nr:AzlD domain-containing protein [Oscillospiraceae bacterium]MBQ6901567.1 AzlD domain-containing protein [Oscillospiraceae bacterium]